MRLRQFWTLILLGVTGSVIWLTDVGAKPPPTSLELCSAMDGGQLAVAGTRQWVGTTAALQTFYWYRVTDSLGNESMVSVPSGTRDARSCVSVPVAKGRVVIEQLGTDQLGGRELKSGGGWGLSAIDTEPAHPKSVIDFGSTTAMVKIAHKPVTVTFSNRLLCTTNWSNTVNGQFVFGGYCQDGNAGLASIEATTAENASVVVDPFTPGTKELTGFTITKLGSPLRVVLRAITTDGVSATLLMTG
jgi:hypothetical protein